MHTYFHLALGALPMLLLATSVSQGQSAPREWQSPFDVGGGGGAAFTARCPRYSYLAGFSGALGDDLDSVLPLCAELNGDGSRGQFTIADVQSPSGLIGGNNGAPFEAVCPRTAPFVRTLRVEAEGVASIIVNSLSFGCGPIEGGIPRGIEGVSLFVFRGPSATSASGGIGISNGVRLQAQDLPCDAGTTFAGIKGRAAMLVDAIGAVCRSVERLPQPPTLSQDRPVVTNPAVSAATGPARSNPIADVALQQGGNAPLGSPAQSLEPNQLLCRGGDVYATGRYGQVPGKPEQEYHVIFLRASQNPAGSDGSGLSLGRCAFANEVATDVASIAVAIDVGSGTLAELDAYMRSDSSHFWSFLLRKNDAVAMQEAIRHGQWIPPARATSAVQSTAPIQGTAGARQQVAAIGGRFPVNLYQMNDGATITVGARQMTVRSAKTEVEAELDRLAEPTRSFAFCVIAAQGCEAATGNAPTPSTPATPPPSAQSNVLPAFIYGIRNDSVLLSSHHSGATPGDPGRWTLTQEVNQPMAAYAALVTAGREALYGATTSDTLRFWNAVELHAGGTDRSILVPAFAPSAYRQIAGAMGNVYGFKADGTVDVFRNSGLGSGGTAWQGPQQVANDWPAFARVISGGDGIFYTLTTDGRLLWRRHLANGSWSAMVPVATGWGGFREVASPGNGIIYTIQPNGDMLWHRFIGHQSGAAGDGWQGPTKVGDGWGNYRSIIALPAF